MFPCILYMYIGKIVVQSRFMCISWPRRAVKLPCGHCVVYPVGIGTEKNPRPTTRPPPGACRRRRPAYIAAPGRAARPRLQRPQGHTCPEWLRGLRTYARPFPSLAHMSMIDRSNVRLWIDRQPGLRECVRARIYGRHTRQVRVSTTPPVVELIRSTVNRTSPLHAIPIPNTRSRRCRGACDATAGSYRFGTRLQLASSIKSPTDTYALVAILVM